MNRRDFFKFFGAAAAALVVGPQKVAGFYNYTMERQGNNTIRVRRWMGGELKGSAWILHSTNPTCGEIDRGLNQVLLKWRCRDKTGVV